MPPPPVYFLKMRTHSPIIRSFLAEFIATFILVSFGCGSIAQMLLSNETKGTFFSVNFSWGIGVTLGCYWAGGISDALNHFDNGIRHVTGEKATASVWATYPQPWLSTQGAFGDQVFGTMLLTGCIFAILDKHNNAPDKGTAPILIGLTVFCIGTAFGFNCGYAINPARDLGPRLFTAMAGWGGEVFTVYHSFAWVPVVACLVGGVAGALIYMLFVEIHHPGDGHMGESVAINTKERGYKSIAGQE
ncbi:aquaporin-9 isoform X2 [Nematostella vectensis]|uniref:aquaporin-9 isoform X2 n=1 Tax=Nematostella vectensis TaxID=45351 RepID=UPI002076D667|nr:aquaporin-9 isoform X2 [Nematostella vectensis]